MIAHSDMFVVEDTVHTLHDLGAWPLPLILLLCLQS